jgi:GT2 family glycosyltransferase
VRPDTPKVTVVIPNYNGAHHLSECLSSLRQQTFSDFETIVVDNASTDGTVDLIKGEHPEVRLIELASNTGFAGAVNAGAMASEAEYVVFLNNDTRAEPTWLAALVRGMDENPSFSFGSSKLLRYDSGLIDSAGHTYSLWLGAGANVGELEPAERYSERGWVFGTCAAASIYRSTLFDDIGVFDEDFFFAHEDVEFDLRANVAGHRCLLVADAIVHHKRGASTDYAAELDLMGVRNRMWLAAKNLPPLALSMWIGGKALRVFWWLPARVLRVWNGAQGPTASTPHRTTSSRLRVSDILTTFGQTVKTLPRKRREAKSLRRIGSRELLHILKETRSPQPLGSLGAPWTSP